MRLLINTASARQGGSVQVAYSFIRECEKIEAHQYGLIAGPSLQKLLDQSPPLRNFKIYKVNKRPAQTPVKAFCGTIYDHIEEDFEPDVVFTTSGPSYWNSRAPHLMGYNLPHYIYPESPFFSMIGAREKARWWLWKQLIKYFYRRDADALVVQTDDVNERARMLLGIEDVTTVFNTCGSHFKNGNHAPFSGLNREPGKEYLLYLTSYYTHKNVEIINRVVPLLERMAGGRFVFVLTLRDADYRSAIDSDVSNQVINIGPVKPEECPGLYAEVDYSFQPTLLECFSASYAESMAMGRPILTSDMGFARTICGDAAEYFDPMDAQSIASCIMSLADNKTRQLALVKLGRTRLQSFCDASERAEKYLTICQRLIDCT